MIHDVMDNIGLKVVQDRDRHRSIGQYAKETDRPIGGVTPDQRHFVSRFYASLSQQDMKLLHVASDIFK